MSASVSYHSARKLCNYIIVFMSVYGIFFLYENSQLQVNYLLVNLSLPDAEYKI